MLTKAEFKIEYDDIFYPTIDDKRDALEHLIAGMKDLIDNENMDGFVTIKRRETSTSRWVTVYKGSYV